jgi:hypothetical protein
LATIIRLLETTLIRVGKRVAGQQVADLPRQIASRSSRRHTRSSSWKVGQTHCS